MKSLVDEITKPVIEKGRRKWRLHNHKERNSYFRFKIPGNWSAVSKVAFSDQPQNNCFPIGDNYQETDLTVAVMPIFQDSQSNQMRHKVGNNG